MGWHDRRHNLALLIFLLIAVIPLTAFSYSTRGGMKAIKIIDGDDVYVGYSTAETVAQLLKEKHITLDYNDLSSPGLNAPVQSGMVVLVKRVEVNEYREQVEFSTPARVSRNSALPAGKEILMQPGRPGLREVVKHVARIGGQPVIDRTLQSRVLRQPERQVMMVGTGRQQPVTVGMPAEAGGRVVTMEATAYAPDMISCGKTDGITAIGLRAGYGIVAVDRRVIPLGTRLYVEGYGPALAGDVGGAIRGNRIDLCYNTHAEAVRFGRRMVKVHILD